MPPVERHGALKADYRVMQENMIFGESSSFEELMTVVSEIEERVNAPA